MAPSDKQIRLTDRLPKIIQILEKQGIGAGVGFMVWAQIFMANEVQAKIPFENRNALLAAMAFLLPFEQIFLFLEDTMSVRINHAMGAEQYATANKYFHVGVGGGLLLGLAAGVIGSIISVITPLYHVFVVPKEYDLPGCDLITDQASVADNVSTYWLLTVWRWVFVFVGMVCAGFLMGAKQTGIWGWSLGLSYGAMVLTWTIGGSQDLDLLGFANFVQAFTNLF